MQLKCTLSVSVLILLFFFLWEFSRVHAMSSFSIRKKGKIIRDVCPCGCLWIKYFIWKHPLPLFFWFNTDICTYFLLHEILGNQASKSSDEYMINAVWSTPCIFCIACWPPFLFGHHVPGQKAYKNWARPWGWNLYCWCSMSQISSWSSPRKPWKVGIRCLEDGTKLTQKILQWIMCWRELPILKTGKGMPDLWRSSFVCHCNHFSQVDWMSKASALWSHHM